MLSARSTKCLAGALLAAALALGSAEALPAKVTLSAKVAASSWQALRLHGLIKGASLAIRVESSGPIAVMLVHESELARFPDTVRPVFAGGPGRRVAFRVRLEEDGIYFVILDNRAGRQERSVRVLMEALRAPSPPAPKDGAVRRGMDAIGYDQGQRSAL